MLVRKLAVAALAAALMGASTQPSKAFPPPVAAAPVVAGTGVGAAIVGGIFGFAVLAIIYDLHLKWIGAKSWDGTTPPKPHH
ncbi:MAG: hypothetical protein K2X60_13600 [Xanthobacteraceae bacterium]|nr:hypothetical protein [Xanthobacteraceae bacterium]